MIKVSDAFKTAIVGSPRRIEVMVVVDISDPDAIFSEVTGAELAPWSKPSELHDHVFDAPTRYVTLERNRWLLDGSFDVFPDQYQVSEQIGIASSELSGEGGVFDSPVWVQLNFSGIDVLQACSVFFSDDSLDGYPVDFTVEVIQGNTAYFTKSFTGNTSTKVMMDGFTVNNPDAIRVTCSKWSQESRRVRIVEILPGLYEQWDSNALEAFSVKQQGDVSCIALPYGTCTLKIDNLSRRFEPRNKLGLFRSLEDKQGIEVYIGVKTASGDIERCKLGIFYQHEDGWKTGDNGLTIQWDLIDIIGLLADREFLIPDTLPTTLGGWISALVAQLGVNFENRWHVDPDYLDKSAIIQNSADIRGKKCGEILRWVCMATGTWPRADASTGDLTAEPLWNEGNKITLDNLTTYPTISANSDVAVLIFNLNDGNNTQYIVSGNSTASSETLSISNPFIKTQNEALTVAKLILSKYGGNVINLTGRGDPTSEIGDVDTVWLDESQATTARRIMQTFQISSGVLQGCQSQLLQADGSFLYEQREVITESGTWIAPTGKTKLRVILVGKGNDGSNGTDGSWSKAGTDGVDGLGALIWSDTISINEQQSFDVSIGENTVFGAYSSANGNRYGNGYTDIQSGESYARTGVKSPRAGSGDGGVKGLGGNKGEMHEVKRTGTDGSSWTRTVIDAYPGKGTPGTPGAYGCVVVYYDK